MRFGNHDCDRLTCVMDLVILQGEIRLPMRMKMAPGLRRRIQARHIAVREDRQHTRGRFRGGDVEEYGSTVRDRAVDDGATHSVWERYIGGVMRTTSDLEAP